jgi:3-deoxy-manno-octulosonate cytidylyltransferase (CMP-KDO synthetase)
MSALGIIPARYASTRLPGKPLVDLGGQSMIQRVVAQARRAGLARVVVATDDQRILDHVLSFGGEAVLTRPNHPSGTDRVWEAFDLLGQPAEVSCIVNIQGDEPFIHPAQIDALVGLFAQDQPPAIATLIKPVLTTEELFSPHLPKVVTNQRGQALYFSRHPLPYQRQYPGPEWLAHHQY